MAAVKLQQQDDPDQVQQPARSTGDIFSDDERSVAADSWSIKSEYGSTLDDEQRHVDAVDALSSANFRPPSDYSSDKDEIEADGLSSMLGLQSYWDAAYADELANFREHGHSGEVWFGADVLETVVSWTTNMCASLSNLDDDDQSLELNNQSFSEWSILDLGTGNGILLQELAKKGFSDLTGVDYSEGAIELARSLAIRNNFPNIKFLVDDVLKIKMDRQYRLVMDKGTLDAIGLHPEGPSMRVLYWESMSKIVASGGLLVLTSCNNTKDELIAEVESYNQKAIDEQTKVPPFVYFDHVRTYPTFMFGGAVGSRVATVAFKRN